MLRHEMNLGQNSSYILTFAPLYFILCPLKLTY
jgi:hypothetical protein